MSAGAGMRSDAEIFQGSLVVPSTGACSTAGDGCREGGGVFRGDSAGSGRKDLRCRAISALKRGASSLSPVNKYLPLCKY